MMKNPEHKGKWNAPYVDNPAYKGVWKPRKIANPKYYEDKTPSNFEPIGAIGFELWTMQKDILFDNIYIGHSVEDANTLKAETYDLKIVAEKAEEDATKPKVEEKPKSPSDLKFMDDPIFYIREKVELFIAIAKNDPINAIKFVPEVAGAIGAIIVLFITLIVVALGGIGGTSSKPDAKDAAKKVADKAAESEDKAADSTTTGAEKSKEEVQKRTTRSSDKSS